MAYPKGQPYTPAEIDEKERVYWSWAEFQGGDEDLASYHLAEKGPTPRFIATIRQAWGRIEELERQLRERP